MSGIGADGGLGLSTSYTSNNDSLNSPTFRYSDGHVSMAGRNTLEFKYRVAKRVICTAAK